MGRRTVSIDDIKTQPSDMTDEEESPPSSERQDFALEKSRKIDVRKWPTVAAAARMLRVQASTIRRFVRNGDLNPVKDPEGVLRFDPDELAELNPDEEVSHGELLKIATNLGAETRKFAEQAAGHAERMVSLIEKPMQSLLDAQAKMLQRAMARIDALEERRSSDIDAAEEARSLNHERQLKEREFAVREARMNKAFETLLGYAPVIIHRLTQSLDKDGKPVDEKPAEPITAEEDVKLLVSILAKDPERIASLSMLLGQAQAMKLLEIGRTYQAGKRPDKVVGEGIITDLILDVLGREDDELGKIGAAFGAEAYPVWMRIVEAYKPLATEKM